MNIIFEGIDKAGKSTLIRDVRDHFISPPVVFKITKKPIDASGVPELVRVYQELFAQTRDPRNDQRHFIFDRSYPSELVYSIKRGYDSMENEELRILDENLGRNGKTVLVYCEADPETIARRFREDNEEYAQQSEIQTLLNRYETFLAKTAIPWIRINSTEDPQKNCDSVMDFVEQILEESQS